MCCVEEAGRQEGINTPNGGCYSYVCGCRFWDSQQGHLHLCSKQHSKSKHGNETSMGSWDEQQLSEVIPLYPAHQRPKKTQASKATAQKYIRDACPASVVLAIFHAEAGACVPSFDFFTGVLHFERTDNVTGVSRVSTC